MTVILRHKAGADVFILGKKGEVLFHTFADTASVANLIANGTVAPHFSGPSTDEIHAKAYDKDYTAYVYHPDLKEIISEAEKGLKLEKAADKKDVKAAKKIAKKVAPKKVAAPKKAEAKKAPSKKAK